MNWDESRDRVRIVNAHDVGLTHYRKDSLAVLVDGKPLDCVAKIEVTQEASGGPPQATLTLIGVGVDLTAAPDFLVRVVGPGAADAAAT